MAPVFGSLLSRVPGLRRKSTGSNGKGQLPADVRDYLTKEFKLLPEDIKELRCIERPESFGLSARRFIRIFDAAKAREQGIVISKSRDLDRHPDLVLYYGRLGKRGVSYLKREQRVDSFRKKK
jgi:hypothetical protein